MTNQQIIQEFREKFTYASFCWNGDMKTGKRFAQNTKKDIESFLLSALQEKDAEKEKALAEYKAEFDLYG